jgi:hypothetical protein
MSEHVDNEQQDINNTILKDCMQRILIGDADAGFDLAQFVLGELPDNDAGIWLALIEGLIRQSEMLGSTHAQKYLEEIWPDMRKIMTRRLKQKGCTDRKLAWVEETE